MGTAVHVFQDVYVSRLLREAHIFISLLNEERKGEREREKGRSEEDKMQAIRRRISDDGDKTEIEDMLRTRLTSSV